MSLLLSFFVLLLSFSTMDVIKFKKMTESMVEAFGVQRDIAAVQIPMGTSIIAQHFSPAPVEPTPLEEIRQSASQTSARPLDSQNLQLRIAELQSLLIAAQRDSIETEAAKIRAALQQEIEQNLVSVETENLNIIIRVHEQGSFPSGSAHLKTPFIPIMTKIGTALQDIQGRIIVAGHTDDRPINTPLFRSNWELSSARAVTVAHALLENPAIFPKRLEVKGLADTRPLVGNTSEAQRTQNRRVEIIVKFAQEPAPPTYQSAL